MNEAALTAEEHELMRALCGVAASFYGIISREDGRSREGDYAEVVFHIHALQNMVLAQAAARDYPGRYRLMGQEIEQAA